MRRLLPLAIIGLTLTACAGMGGMRPPEGLAYDIPDPNPATYAFSDTSDFAVDAGAMGVIDVQTIREGTAELDFRRSPSGLRVEVRFPRFRGTFENPAQGTTRTDEEDIGGPVGLSLGYRGRLEVADTPSLSAALLSIAGPETLVRSFFVPLPGRHVQPGARWADTVATVEESAGTVSRSTSIVTARLSGDTIVAGRTLLQIMTTTTTEVLLTGVSGGVEVEQRLTGRSTGRILWDAEDDVLVERTEEGELSGTLAMPETGAAPLPVSAAIRRRVLLRP